VSLGRRQVTCLVTEAAAVKNTSTQTAARGLPKEPRGTKLEFSKFEGNLTSKLEGKLEARRECAPMAATYTYPTLYT
jgi:hypothetical protein